MFRTPLFLTISPTAVRVIPLPAPTECNMPSGSTCPLPPLMMILPPTIIAGKEPVCRHPALVNVLAPSKLLFSSGGAARGEASFSTASSNIQSGPCAPHRSAGGR
jgi:hypothetical protein